MTEPIAAGQMVFIAPDGREGVGAVRRVTKTSVIVYVENSGEFEVPLSAVTGVQSQKVMLDVKALSKAFQAAIGHAHDREDPKLTG